jgi:hypothetical protein
MVEDQKEHDRDSQRYEADVYYILTGLDDCDLYE